MNGFLQYQSTCRKCGGTGTIITDPCKPCRGRGYRNQNHTVDVEVPAGVDDGMGKACFGRIWRKPARGFSLVIQPLVSLWGRGILGC